MALRGFIAMGFSRIQNNVILPKGRVFRGAQECVTPDLLVREVYELMEGDKYSLRETKGQPRIGIQSDGIKQLPAHAIILSANSFSENSTLLYNTIGPYALSQQQNCKTHQHRRSSLLPSSTL
jgi:hypothetical protein